MMPVFWLLGLSGSGKTTLGSLLRIHLESNDYDVEFIDDDRFRTQFRHSNIYPNDKIKYIDSLRDNVIDHQNRDKICIVTAITPYTSMREKNREQIPNYKEIWINSKPETLLKRDVKGLFTKALYGEIPFFSGFSDVFDEPNNPDLIINTDCQSLANSYTYLRDYAEICIDEHKKIYDHTDGMFINLENMENYVSYSNI